MKKTITMEQLKRVVKEGLDIDVEIPTVSAREYLATDNGKDAVKLYEKHVNELGEKPAKTDGLRFAIASELHYNLKFRSFTDFKVKDSIMEADPADVVYSWIEWEDDDYAVNILTDHHHDEHDTEIEAAFGKWGMKY